MDGQRKDDRPWLFYKLTSEPKGSGELTTSRKESIQSNCTSCLLKTTSRKESIQSNCTSCPRHQAGKNPYSQIPHPVHDIKQERIHTVKLHNLPKTTSRKESIQSNCTSCPRQQAGKNPYNQTAHPVQDNKQERIL